MKNGLTFRRRAYAGAMRVLMLLGAALTLGLTAFLAGVVCDMLDTPGALRLLSPLKYFLPSDLLAGKLDFAYLLLILGASAALLAAAFRRFGKKDLNAVS